MRNKPAGKILMLLESHYPEDVRVQQEANKLVEYGYQVTVLAQYSRKNQPGKEIINGVTVYRIPLLELFPKSKANGNWLQKLFVRLLSFIGYVFEYFYFTTACFLYSFFILFKEGFDVIHLHNPPNTPFLVGAFFKIFGKKFVFDHHDLCPELYLSRESKNGGFIYRILMLEEKLCLRCADMVIATNESYKQIEIERGKKRPEDVFVVRNGPDLNKKTFQEVAPDERLQSMNKHILAYIGVMGPQDGVDYLVRALGKLVHTLGRTDFYCMIIGKGESVPYLKALAAELQLEDYIEFTGFIPKADLIRYISTAEIGLDPNPSNPLNDYSTWVKVLEYMAFGKPVVSFHLKETWHTAQDAAVYVTPNDELAYAEAIAALMDDPEKRTYMGEYGRERMTSLLCWEHVSRNLVIGYDRLFGIPPRIKEASPNLATLAAKHQDNTNLLSQKAM